MLQLPSTKDGDTDGDGGKGGGDQSFVDAQLAGELWDVRAFFETVSWSRYCRARQACNEYESLSSKDSPNPFVSRSALKLANINYLLQGCLCRPLPSQSGLTFVDLCGGPGGFTEYLLTTCQSQEIPVRGWGMTLVEGPDHCPWEMEALSRWIKPQEGVKAELVLCYGADGTGDLCKPENIDHLVSQIKEANSSQGVGLVVADGGFAGARARFDQEDVMVPLLISEVLSAYKLLAPGGTFICKLFDVALPATAALLHDLALTFDRIAMFKPITSRPASSERYVVCLGYDGGQAINRMEKLQRLAIQGSPLSMTNQHSSFRAYLRLVNDLLMSHQLQACYTIVARLQAWEEEEQQQEQDDDDEQDMDKSPRGEVMTEEDKQVDVGNRARKRGRFDCEDLDGSQEEVVAPAGGEGTVKKSQDSNDALLSLVVRYYKLWGCYQEEQCKS